MIHGRHACVCEKGERRGTCKHSECPGSASVTYARARIHTWWRRTCPTGGLRSTRPPAPRFYRAPPHAWASCPFAHPGKKARRRSLDRVAYSADMCPAVRRGDPCPSGDDCTYVSVGARAAAAHARTMHRVCPVSLRARRARLHACITSAAFELVCQTISACVREAERGAGQAWMHGALAPRARRRRQQFVGVPASGRATLAKQLAMAAVAAARDKGSALVGASRRAASDAVRAGPCTRTRARALL